MHIYSIEEEVEKKNLEDEMILAPAYVLLYTRLGLYHVHSIAPFADVHY